MPKTRELKVVGYSLCPGDRMDLGKHASSTAHEVVITKIDFKVSWMIVYVEDVSTRFEFKRRLPIDAEYKIQRTVPTQDETDRQRDDAQASFIAHRCVSAENALKEAIKKQVAELTAGYGLSWSTTGRLAQAQCDAAIWKQVETVAHQQDPDDDTLAYGYQRAVKIVGDEQLRHLLVHAGGSGSSDAMSRTLDEYALRAAARFTSQASQLTAQF